MEKVERYSAATRSMFLFEFSIISAYSCYLMSFGPSFWSRLHLLLDSARSSGCSRWKWGMAEVPCHFPYSSSRHRWLQCVHERLWEEQSVASCCEAFCRHAWDEACGFSTSTFSAKLQICQLLEVVGGLTCAILFKKSLRNWWGHTPFAWIVA